MTELPNTLQLRTDCYMPYTYFFYLYFVKVSWSLIKHVNQKTTVLYTQSNVIIQYSLLLTTYYFDLFNSFKQMFLF